MNSFSYSIDVKRFQNLLDTAVDDIERQKIQSLLAEEKAKVDVQPPDSKKD